MNYGLLITFLTLMCKLQQALLMENLKLKDSVSFYNIKW